MDLAMAIDKLIPSAEYFGSTNDNTEEAFDKLNWLDKRKKPTWKEIENAYELVKVDFEAEKEMIANLASNKATAEAKLAALGLTAEDLKALGL